MVPASYRVFGDLNRVTVSCYPTLKKWVEIAMLTTISDFRRRRRWSDEEVLVEVRWGGAGGGVEVRCWTRWRRGSWENGEGQGQYPVAPLFQLVTKANPAQYMKNVGTFFFPELIVLELHMFYKNALKQSNLWENVKKKNKNKKISGGLVQKMNLIFKKSENCNFRRFFD